LDFDRGSSSGIAQCRYSRLLELEIFRPASCASVLRQPYSASIFKQVHIKDLRSWFDRLTTNANI
jgi:hypothetical protein